MARLACCYALIGVFSNIAARAGLAAGFPCGSVQHVKGLQRALVRALPGAAAAARIPARWPPAANPPPRNVRPSVSPLGESSASDLISRDGHGGMGGGWRGRGAALKRMRGGGDGADWPLRSSSGVSSPAGGRDTTEDIAGEREVEGGGLSGSGLSAAGGGDGGESVSKKKQSLFKTLWEFSRPHTMIGTAVAIPAIGVFAGPPGVLPGRRFFLSMLWAMVPSLLINVFITGLNQITDVEIDKVNKPYLPIPAGNLTSRAAKLTVTLCLLAGAVLGLAPCSLGSPGLSLTVVLSVLIGTVYSLPPIRLKRFPQVAALCILVVRGSIINGGFYSHAQLAGYGLSGEKTALWALTLPFRDAKCALALAYFTVFAVVIALMKDVPDVAGDRMFNIPSFSVVLGEIKLFAFARRLLTALLWSTAAALGVGAKAAASAGLPLTSGLRGLVSALALITGQLVRRRAAGVDPEQPKQVYDFYMDLWKIFYLSYLFLPLAR